MKLKKYEIKTNKIPYLFLIIYLIAISAYQLTSMSNKFIVIISFIGLIFSIIIFYKKVSFNNEVKWIIAFWIYYFLSLLWASNVSDTLLCFNSAIQLIALSMFLPVIIKDENKVNLCIKFIIFSLIYTCILVLIKTPLNSIGTTRIGEAIGLHPNVLGMRLAIGTLLCLYCFHDTKNKKSKIIYLIVIAVFMVIALLTGSKKAILMIILGVGLYELFVSKGIAKLFLKVVLLILAMIILLYAVFNNQYLYKILGQRIEVTLQTLVGGEETDESYIERNYYMEQALKLFKEHPIIGVGGDNFMSYMREIGYSHIAYSHNNFTELLSTLGIIGFVLYYIFWIITEISLISTYLKKRSNLILLFTVIITIILLMDYGNVSYYSDFNFILLILTNIMLKLEKEKISLDLEKCYESSGDLLKKKD